MPICEAYARNEPSNIKAYCEGVPERTTTQIGILSAPYRTKNVARAVTITSFSTDCVSYWP